MERLNVRDELFPAHYNHFLVDWQRRELGLSKRAVARLIGRRHSSVNNVFRGRASSELVYPVAQVLGLDWAKVHDLTLVESDYPHCIRADLLRGAQLIAPTETVKQCL